MIDYKASDFHYLPEKKRNAAVTVFNSNSSAATHNTTNRGNGWSVPKTPDEKLAGRTTKALWASD